VGEGDPDIGGIQLMKVRDDFSNQRLVAEFCSFECDLRYHGVKIFEGEIEAMLKARVRERK
jgi:hypothetical protein